MSVWRPSTPAEQLYDDIMEAIQFAAPRDAIKALEDALAQVRISMREYERSLGK
jgi:hypothetical protein